MTKTASAEVDLAIEPAVFYDLFRHDERIFGNAILFDRVAVFEVDKHV